MTNRPKTQQFMNFYNHFFFFIIDFLIETSISGLKKPGKNLEKTEGKKKSAENANLPRIPSSRVAYQPRGSLC